MTVQNRVGDVMPTDEERAGLQTDATAIFDRLRHFGITLTPDEQRTAPRPQGRRPHGPAHP